MQKYLGYIMFSLGVGVLAGRTFKGISSWITYLVVFLIICGLITLLETYKMEAKKETQEELEK